MLSVGWVEVVFTRYKFEDDGVFFGLEECRVAKVGGDEDRATFQSIFLEPQGRFRGVHVKEEGVVVQMLNAADDGCLLVGVVLKGKFQYVEFFKSFVEFGTEVRDVSWRLAWCDCGVRGVVWDEDGAAGLDKSLLGMSKVGREVGIVGIGEGCSCAV